MSFPSNSPHYSPKYFLTLFLPSSFFYLTPLSVSFAFFQFSLFLSPVFTPSLFSLQFALCSFVAFFIFCVSFWNFVAFYLFVTLIFSLQFLFCTPTIIRLLSLSRQCCFFFTHFLFFSISFLKCPILDFHIINSTPKPFPSRHHILF